MVLRVGHSAESGGHCGGDRGSVGTAVEQVPVAEVGRVHGPVLDGLPGGGFVGVGLKGEAARDDAREMLTQVRLLRTDLRRAHAKLMRARCMEGGEIDTDEHGADQQYDRYGEQDGTQITWARRRTGHVQGVLVRPSGGDLLRHRSRS